MENVNQSPGFWSMFGRMFKLFFGNLRLFLPVLVVYGVLLIAASFGWMALVAASVDATGVGLGFWFLMIAFLVVMMIVGISYSLSLMKCAFSVVKGEQIGPMAAVSFGFRNFWGGLKAGFRAGWYVAWPVLVVVVVLLVFAIVNTFLGGKSMAPAIDFGGLNVFDAVGAEGFEAPVPELYGDTEAEEADFGGPAPEVIEKVMGDDFVGLPELTDSMGGFAFSDAPPPELEETALMRTILRSTNFGLALIGFLAVLLMFVFFIIRGPKAAFTLYEFVDSPRSGGDCLRASIDLVKGRVWTVLWFLVFMNIILAIIFLVPFEFAYELMGLESTSGLVKGINNLLSLVMGALGVLFMTQFFFGLKKK